MSARLGRLLALGDLPAPLTNGEGRGRRAHPRRSPPRSTSRPADQRRRGLWPRARGTYGGRGRGSSAASARSAARSSYLFNTRSSRGRSPLQSRLPGRRFPGSPSLGKTMVWKNDGLEKRWSGSRFGHPPGHLRSSCPRCPAHGRTRRPGGVALGRERATWHARMRRHTRLPCAPSCIDRVLYSTPPVPAVGSRG